MKRIHIPALCFAVALAASLLALPATAFAESYTGAANWTVTFTSSGTMEDTFSATQWADDLSGLQPGDDITFTVTMKHENSSQADWYMNNEVLKSLEERYAEGSAYEYRLVYTNPSGTDRVLFDSTTVGGDSSQGLEEATSGLEDYLYLDRLANGQNAHMTLRVGLDGETEGNAYFNTLAQLRMRFAVELVSDATTTTRANDQNTNRNIVRTGDETNLFPFYVAMSVSGILLALIAIYLITGKRRRQDERSR